MKLAVIARLKGIRREERGDSLVELAITLVVLLTAVFGIMDCSRALSVYHFVSYAAQQGTRYAIVRGANWSASCASTTSMDCEATAADIQNYIRSIAPSEMTASSIIVTTTWPGKTAAGDTGPCGIYSGTHDNSLGCLVQVQVSYPFNFMLAFLPSSGMNFTGSSEQTIGE